MIRRILILSALLGAQPAAAETASAPLRFDAEPALGVTLGEVFRRELRIHAEPGLEFDPASLPAPAPLEDGLELRGAEWSARAGKGERLYLIQLDYQLFRGVRGPERVRLPELPLRFRRGGTVLEAAAPAREITATPLIAAELADDRVMIRSPLPPLQESADAAWLALAASAAALLALLAYASWVLALFPFHWRRRKPFARAWRELPRLLRKGAHEGAFRVIHRALDDTAGYPMFADRLDAFLETHPAFAPLRESLGRFFAASRQLFYAPANRPRQDGYQVAAELRELCRQAMELERQ